jgi:hypothetical protein
MVTPGVEDNIATTVPTGEPSESAGPTQLVRILEGGEFIPMSCHAFTYKEIDDR